MPSLARQKKPGSGQSFSLIYTSEVCKDLSFASPSSGAAKRCGASSLLHQRMAACGSAAARPSAALVCSLPVLVGQEPSPAAARRGCRPLASAVALAGAVSAWSLHPPLPVPSPALFLAAMLPFAFVLAFGLALGLACARASTFGRPLARGWAAARVRSFLRRQREIERVKPAELDGPRPPGSQA